MPRPRLARLPKRRAGRAASPPGTSGLRPTSTRRRACRLPETSNPCRTSAAGHRPGSGRNPKPARSLHGRRGSRHPRKHPGRGAWPNICPHRAADQAARRQWTGGTAVCYDMVGAVRPQARLPKRASRKRHGRRVAPPQDGTRRSRTRLLTGLRPRSRQGPRHAPQPRLHTVNISPARPFTHRQRQRGTSPGKAAGTGQGTAPSTPDIGTGGTIVPTRRSTWNICRRRPSPASRRGVRGVFETVFPQCSKPFSHKFRNRFPGSLRYARASISTLSRPPLHTLRSCTRPFDLSHSSAKPTPSLPLPTSTFSLSSL